MMSGAYWMLILPLTLTRYARGHRRGFWNRIKGQRGGVGVIKATRGVTQKWELGYSNHMNLFFSQPTNFTNPVYATLYMGGHGSRHSLASTDEKRELLGRGPEDEIGDPLA